MWSVIRRLDRGSIGLKGASDGQDVAAVTPRVVARKLEQLAAGLVLSARGASLDGLGTLSERTCCCGRVAAARWDGRV